ncbi:MAG: site-specific DNA-methyltransferase [Cytophagales bacterium CG18_big_fil_WC_8_21_14_2_50_42_9]|nr:MAG: site-specific DNA-methyltransferase [Cytophagales bacterium CG18_big_fil_WC_8_21_14_2_50_42_9]
MQKHQKLELTWIGKGEEPKLEPRILLEQPEYSYGDPNAENILIHGDNLLALKALEQDFTGKIKCIYIDPPFNTGAAFEHYDDGIEHSLWLDLMYKRFKILHKLLRRDGALFVHLDDNESAYCKLILDEIFGRDNYLNQIINTTNKPFGFKSTAGNIFKQANHIFLYTKDKQHFTLNWKALFIEKSYDPAYKFVFKDKTQPEEKWEWENINEVVAKEIGYKSSREAKKSLGEDFDREIALFAIDNSNKVFRTASVSGGAFLKRKNTVALSKQNKDKIIRHPDDDMDYMFIGGERVIYYNERLKVIDGLNLPGELITDIWNDISIEALAKEGNVNFPKGKKPEKLIQRCLELTTSKGDWVLDSFLGSGTTAAVANKMERKWIGVELGNQAYTHCFPRLKQVVDGTDQGGISKLVDWQGGGGFKFYTLAPSLLQKDRYGNWVIDEKYNPDMLAAAMAKQEGFRYQPDEIIYWQQGRSSEKDFIYTTTQFITVEALDKIHEEMQPGQNLLICCKSFQAACEHKYLNITIKKIPHMLLGRCEFGKDDYSLNIINVPTSEEAGNPATEFITNALPEVSQPAAKQKKAQIDLFE